ncbi:MAG: phosphodiester glycosidase family protein, partial [Anaeromyxobacteraceae bacterium]|nr:phosphodiester glycosidase family protein [Anaeromyxobacteraceae bacterium]
MLRSLLLAAAMSAPAQASGPATAPPPAVPAGQAAPQPPFASLEPGLELALLPGPPATQGDGLIAVVRIDPARFKVELLNASAPGEGRPRSVRDWAFRAGASAAINASLYQADWRTAVGLMRSRDHVNHTRVGKDRAVLAFDPVVSGVAPVRIIDRDCEDLDTAGRSYAGLVQSIRMVSCQRVGVWAP